MLNLTLLHALLTYVLVSNSYGSRTCAAIYVYARTYISCTHVAYYLQIPTHTYLHTLTHERVCACICTYAACTYGLIHTGTPPPTRAHARLRAPHARRCVSASHVGALAPSAAASPGPGEGAAQRPCRRPCTRLSERDKWGQHLWGHCNFHVF